MVCKMPEQGPRKVRLYFITWFSINLTHVHCYQQTGDPGKFGGNSENVHPQHTKPVPGKSNSRPGVASSKIPVSKPLRVPLKRVQTQPSTRAAKETTSTRKNSSEVIYNLSIHTLASLARLTFHANATLLHRYVLKDQRYVLEVRSF